MSSSDHALLHQHYFINISTKIPAGSLPSDLAHFLTIGPPLTDVHFHRTQGTYITEIIQKNRKHDETKCNCQCFANTLRYNINRMIPDNSITCLLSVDLHPQLRSFHACSSRVREATKKLPFRSYYVLLVCSRNFVGWRAIIIPVE